jgi:hypothetical protein
LKEVQKFIIENKQTYILSNFHERLASLLTRNAGKLLF